MLWKPCYVVMVVIHERQDGDLVQGDSSRNDEKGSDSGQILKIELTGFAGGFDVGYEKKIGTINDYKIWNQKNGSCHLLNWGYLQEEQV